jgi:hypothetical protein
MNYKDYSTLKTANKVALKKIEATSNTEEHIVLEEKRYNSTTGEEINTINMRIALTDLQREKTQKTAKKDTLQLEIAEIDKMIVDIQAL